MVYEPTYAGGVLQLFITYIADYFPYGKVLREYVNTGSGAERFLTTQHERDKETGLDYRGARFYDSDISRFLSLDPLATEFPAWSAYNYVMGNPISLIDPTGRSPEGTDWKPVIKNNRLMVQQEEGDDAKSLASFLDVSQETANELFNSMDNGTVDPGKYHSTWAINGALRHAKNNSDDYGGSFDSNYNCHECSISLAHGKKIDYNKVHKSNQLSNELNQDYMYTDVTGNPEKYIFSKTLIRFGNSAGRTTHSATYLGTSKDGTVYTWSKNGASEKPSIYTIQQLEKFYESKVQGIGTEKGGGFYNIGF
jgi:RHS repeat-associated protein